MSSFFLTVEMAILINQKVILEHSADEQSGIKDHSLLDSALKRPQQSLFGKDAYPSLHLKAAALLESLAQNHAFHNANKRTALMCTAIFFRYNGYLLRFPYPQLEEDFVVDVVKHRYTLEEVAEILKENTEPI
ncbi:type II toxin-antitoxin system death-on-curing family toxin [Planococcus sp. ISL-110]|uniref:type II toxin-antitoxin system death-on-curing family toxin n=1 Tax=Planococcus sp. ISL-110 TaxID=2819167 RepID=UPI001BE9A438|nr:type II toxin-antitoxin system death-on-curing family toxin [Planococcus sp. ISL-110]MBT2572033.1 type II toxin-antitoxin system death-on-curing family toxin [Planococcus sp. ISL-110]